MEYKDLGGGSINDSISIYNCDCMDLLKQTPDNYYSIAIVDPPYGINVTKTKRGNSKIKPDKTKNWDNDTPNSEYFQELFRVSKNQIIWGGNYFELPPSQYFAIWDKGETMYGRDFAECEQAWVRSGGTRIYKKSPNQIDRIHPTQKPIQLYSWIIQNYAKEGYKILDTHGGSLSIAIAVDKANKIEKMNLTLTACELDTDYFNAAMKRIKQQTAQQTIF